MTDLCGDLFYNRTNTVIKHTYCVFITAFSKRLNTANRNAVIMCTYYIPITAFCIKSAICYFIAKISNNVNKYTDLKITLPLSQNTILIFLSKLTA